MGLLNSLRSIVIAPGGEDDAVEDEVSNPLANVVNDHITNIFYSNDQEDIFPDPDIVDEVLDERLRQNELWGEQNHPAFGWVSILLEEVGEVAKAVNDNDAENYREELIQVAAVAIAAAASFDRNAWGDPWS